MLVAEGMEAVICGDEKIVPGDVAAAAERWSARRDIPGYLVPFLFLRVGDCPPSGESPPVDIEGGGLSRGGGE